MSLLDLTQYGVEDCKWQARVSLGAYCEPSSNKGASRVAVL